MVITKDDTNKGVYGTTGVGYNLHNPLPLTLASHLVLKSNNNNNSSSHYRYGFFKKLYRCTVSNDKLVCRLANFFVWKPSHNSDLQQYDYIAPPAIKGIIILSRTTIGSNTSLNVQLQKRLSADSRSRCNTIYIQKPYLTCTTKLLRQNDKRKYEKWFFSSKQTTVGTYLPATDTPNVREIH